jgi:hypothetical protein
MTICGTPEIPQYDSLSQRELLCFVIKQSPFFIFPPTRIRRNHQKHLIKSAKKFQENKWEELWKQSIGDYDIERDPIQPPKQKSIPEKDHQAQFFHKFGSKSKASKVLNSEIKHTVDPQDVVRIQNLFPLFKRFNQKPPKYALKLTQTSNSLFCQKMVSPISYTSSTRNTMFRPSHRLLIRRILWS